jgi:pimeloyl-ACP methyl ester carboxylesterase
MQPQFLSCLGPSGFHRLFYREWPGPAGAPTLLCVHGLTRNGRDFDVLAQTLSKVYRVVCPDMPGRGMSENLADPAHYSYATYLADLAALIARLDVESLDWVGTSMGGVLGMTMAAQPGTPVRRLVLNDIGAVVAKAGLERIAGYVGLDRNFETLAALADAMASGFVGSGKLPRATLMRIAEGAARRRPDGRFGFAYDPRIADVFATSPPQDVDLFPVWDRIACPTLVLRGEVSDVLTAETAAQMTGRGPRARIVEIAGVGHAPWLATSDEIAVVADFLRAPH